MRKLGFAVLILVPALTGAAYSDVATFPLGSVAVIQSPQSVSRVLTKLPFSLPPGNRVDYAELKFPALSTSEVVTLQGLPLFRSWDPATVTWTFPWQRGGGDYDTLRMTPFAIKGGSGDTVRLDVTRWVREWANGAPNYGVLLKRPVREGNGFSARVSEQVANLLRAGRLTIYYSKR